MREEQRRYEVIVEMKGGGNEKGFNAIRCLDTSRIEFFLI